MVIFMPSSSQADAHPCFFSDVPSSDDNATGPVTEDMMDDSKTTTSFHSNQFPSQDSSFQNAATVSIYLLSMNSFQLLVVNAFVEFLVLIQENGKMSTDDSGNDSDQLYIESNCEDTNTPASSDAETSKSEQNNYQKKIVCSCCFASLFYVIVC